MKEREIPHSPSEKKAREKRKRELVRSVPRILVYGGTAFVIWLFTYMVFIPLGEGIILWGKVETKGIIAVIALVVISVLGLRIFKEIKEICNVIARYLTITYLEKKEGKETKEGIKACKSAIKAVIYVLAAAVIYLFFGSLLNNIHPALSGILLVAIFIWAILILYKGGKPISHKIEARAKEFIKKTIETEEI